MKCESNCSCFSSADLRINNPMHVDIECPKATTMVEILISTLAILGTTMSCLLVFYSPLSLVGGGRVVERVVNYSVCS